MRDLKDLSRDELIALVLAQMDPINELADEGAKREHLGSRNRGNSSMSSGSDGGQGWTLRSRARPIGASRLAPGQRLFVAHGSLGRRAPLPRGLGARPEILVVAVWPDHGVPGPRRKGHVVQVGWRTAPGRYGGGDRDGSCAESLGSLAAGD